MTLVLNFGLPKGSLEEATIKLFGRAGFSISKSSRSYKPCWDDPELDGRFVRAQEMSRYVEDGFFDCGLTGRDWVRENRSDVEIVADLIYSRASNRISKWVLAVPEQSDVQTVKDLEGKSIATELVQVTRDYLKENEVEAEVEFSWGATEVKVPELVDAIVDLTETGSSLRANNLRVVDVLMETNTVLIANKRSLQDPDKKAKVENIALMLQAALHADDKVGLKLNIEKAKLGEIIEQMPALRRPTVSSLTDDSWVAIETVIEKKVSRELIPALKRRGAEGIVEYPLNKIVP
ncbi:MAG: ATP phosphoribosyltransferase [Verrucomicrobiota bacterium]|nr:ATP phosphoribosyltransferase [Opitutae bacterium]MEC7393880.1 ATP phosphoribosyltransferase [Verrucomicrobiota bacterium]MEC7542343.1 ATP phosphoribosyltransferase [Verrucomicrobiota bacterium]MEC8655257.1 ATP phosphoribosyltransferase [Verrucomicrobiota bacterium]MEC8789607.1 ATP phosphoribosyltransferase [Verrucomicrobiota bacterium]|tara:strand:- start:9094 stop:9969 length:876 start_codon:yes stop_codon:yes gene_type:complete